MVMVSRNQLKFLRSLHQKKYRKRYSEFIVEGDKAVNELLSDKAPLSTIYAKAEWLEQNGGLVNKLSVPIVTVTEEEMKKISALSSPSDVLATCEFTAPQQPPLKLKSGQYLILEDIRDPGNLGTILRTADWFGISGLILSPTTVDPFNPKCVQSSMGSILRVPLFQCDLEDWLLAYNGFPVIGTSLKGDNIYQSPIPESALFIIGNESKGLSKVMEAQADKLIYIPKIGKAESLNAAVAAAILCAELKRPR